MTTFRRVVLYTDRDGRARFREDEVTLPEGTPQAMLSEVFSSAGYQLRHSPSASAASGTARRSPQWVFILEGEMEIGLQDGSSRVFKPGEHFFSADTLPAGRDLRSQGARPLERAARREPAGHAVRQDLRPGVSARCPRAAARHA